MRPVLISLYPFSVRSQVLLSMRLLMGLKKRAVVARLKFLITSATAKQKIKKITKKIQRTHHRRTTKECLPQSPPQASCPRSTKASSWFLEGRITSNHLYLSLI